MPELQVVTATGRAVTCSEQRNRDLFQAALAGQGQVAVIVRATLRLVPAPAHIRIFNLIYADVATMTAEATRLMDDGRFDYPEAFTAPLPNASRIRLLQAGSCFTAPAQPDDGALLAGLRDVRSAPQIEDARFVDFASRVPVNVPKQPHPWIGPVELEREDWRRRHGPEFGRLARAKRRHDPNHVIASGPDIF